MEIAKYYNTQGADEIVFLDITASHEKRDIILDVVERTAREVFMPLTVGAGYGRRRTLRTSSGRGRTRFL